MITGLLTPVIAFGFSIEPWQLFIVIVAIGFLLFGNSIFKDLRSIRR